MRGMTDSPSLLKPESAIACRNCGHVLLPAPRNYCPECGQETRIRPPALGEFLQQFAGNYIAAEGALWRTLKLLLLRPGAITREYLDGRRRRYVLPLRLYLTVSVLVLFLVQATGPVDVTLDDKDFQSGLPQHLEFNVGFGRAGMEKGVFYCEGLPETICQRIRQRVDIDRSKVLSEIQAWGTRFLGHIGGAMFLLLPSFALWMRLVYRNRRLHYTEHLVFALHVHTYWFVMLGVAQLPWGGVKFLAIVAVPVYTLLAMGTVYEGRWWPRILRAAVVSILYAISLVVAVGGVAMWALFF